MGILPPAARRPDRGPGAVGSPRQPTRSSIVGGSLACLLLLGCTAPPEDGLEWPLIDGFHAPEVLAESRRLEMPPSPGGNRFARGWRSWQDDGGVHLFPGGAEAVMEFVHLEPRERRLVLDVEKGLTSPATVRVADGEPQTLPLAAGEVEVTLPADLPLGRVTVTLSFADPAAAIDLVLGGAGFRRVSKPGEAVVEAGPGRADDIAQSGTSFVDLVRWVEDGTVLRGRFVAPGRAGPEQSFAVLVEDGAGSVAEVFHWPSSGFLGRSGSSDFAAGLPAGLVRIRLVARGDGPAGRWRDLRLVLRSAEPAAEVAPPPPPQVVVVYVLDALRADYVGHLGGPAGATPTLDRLAAGGVSFTAHLSVAPNTLPSTKSFFLGRAFRRHGGWKLAPDGPATLAEIFTGAGYRTAAFSGNTYVSEPYGLLRGFEQRTVEDFKENDGPYNNNAERVHRSALAWLAREVRDGDRLFLYLHAIHPHNPYDPPQPFRDAFAPPASGSTIDGTTANLLAVKRGRLATEPADQDRLRGLYAGGLAYADAQLATLLAELGRRYPPGEVLVLVTADHGEELFDHGGLLHGYSLYEEQLRIPLIAWWPGRLPPHRIDTATDSLDLHATLRSLVGAPPAPEGRPLWGELLGGDGTGPPSGPPGVRFAAASSLKGGIFMARSDRLKLIWAPQTPHRHGMGDGRGRSHDSEYLFDLGTDPQETANLAGLRSLEADWLRSRLQAWIARGEDGGVEAEIDDETRDSLRALGYLE